MSAEMSDQKSEPATLQVAGEDVKLNGEQKDEEIDLSERDPNDMNAQVKIKFEDIIGEPDPEVYSFDKVWVLSFKAFSATKLWCYRISSLLCALPLSVCWGCYFACVAFCRIWVCVPCLKSIDIELLCFRRVYTICLQTFCAPWFEAAGKFWSNINLRITKVADM